MKIALIGNMNNNFFSQMRYFRDLGMNAHLFLYQNEYEHFLPHYDTYQIEKYEPYIHTLSVESSGKGLLLANLNKIKEELQGYDFFIGCGIAPALFLKLKYQLDIFIPYAEEFELTSDDVFKLSARGFFNLDNILKYPIRRYTVSQQIKGIKHHTSKIIASGVMQVTKDTIERLNLADQHIKKYLLMVYKEESQLKSPYIERMKKSDLVVFSHTRQHWKDLKGLEKEDGVKALDKLIIGYRDFIEKNPKVNPVLIFFEYGKDVDASKALIKKLDIEEYVQWLPLMPRKEIMGLIQHADIVVDALASSMWGGVGWEGLSRAKIMMQNILQTNEEYYAERGHNLPFIMKANKAEHVQKHLEDFIQNRAYFKEKSEENRIWFDNYAGIGLAQDYKNIIEELYDEKMK